MNFLQSAIMLQDFIDYARLSKLQDYLICNTIYFARLSTLQDYLLCNTIFLFSKIIYFARISGLQDYISALQDYLLARLSALQDYVNLTIFHDFFIFIL